MKRLIALLLMTLFLSSCATAPSQGKPDYMKRQGASPADVYVQLGVGYMQQGNNSAALDSLKKAVKVDSRSSNAHGVLAVLYERLAENALAETHYKRAISLDGGNASTLNNYGRFLCNNGKATEAAGYFKKSYENPLNRKSWIALSNAGQCEFKQGRLEQAEVLLRKALQVNPRFPGALSSMAQIKLQQKNYMSVRAYLQRFREVTLHTPETLWIGIQSEHELGDADTVASYVITLRSKFPDAEEVGLLDKKYPQYR